MSDKAVLHKLLRLGDIATAPDLLIFSDEPANRLTFVCKFIFNHVLKINFLMTNDSSEFEKSLLLKINYSEKNISNSFWIVPSGLLSQSAVLENKPQPETENDMIYFYKVKKPDAFHFDIFSAIFYFISRYEEWQNFEKDIHGRFELKESILFKNNFHLKPVIDIWIEELKGALLQKYSTFKFPKKEFKTIATIDVDNLFAYKNKGFVRTLGAGLKDVIKFDFKNLKRRMAVIMNKAKDPFDIYKDFSRFCDENKISLIYFFLFRTGTSFDRTVNPKSNSYKKVFESIKKNKSFIGLHPSYYSSVSEESLKEEVSSFSKKLDSQVILSRQHYLRFDIKTTPALLLENNILMDFSMGFASGSGFRAGTSHPFYYYDFKSEKQTELLFVPFCVMDGAYFIYNNINADEAYLSILKIKEEVKKVNGLFISVFHERTFADHLYPGFGEMYKKLLLN